eukprot:UN25360
MEEMLNNPEGRRDTIAMLHQHDDLYEYYQDFSTIEVVYWETFGMVSMKDIKTQLKELELDASGPQKYKILSGGQKIRVRLAISLLRGSPILFLDEVTSGQDR